MKGKIFTAQKIQAMKAGNAVMFREVIKPQPWHVVVDADFKKGNNIPKHGHDEKEIKYPYQVGQKIFCKETFVTTQFGKAVYRMDAVDQSGARWYSIEPMDPKKEALWRPAQHMKQEHSRLTLEITGIRVERLGEISYEDCLKEGIEKVHGYHNSTFPEKYDYVFKDYTSGGDYITHNPRKSFWTLWNATHKKPEEKFEASPFVWVFSCEVVK